MKLKDLLKILNKLPPDAEVYCYDDGDGGYGATYTTPAVHVDTNSTEVCISADFYPGNTRDKKVAEYYWLEVK